MIHEYAQLYNSSELLKVISAQQCSTIETPIQNMAKLDKWGVIPLSEWQNTIADLEIISENRRDCVTWSKADNKAVQGNSSIY